jgi:hypothetical protein
MSRALAIKYARSYANEIGISGENFGARGVDDNTAYNAFCAYMSNPINQDKATYWNISHDLYMWHSLAAIRKAEYSWGFGVRPTKEFVELIQYGYQNGSTLPKFKREEKS